MIDLETIEREINELETRYDTSYRVCERLSWLYSVRDHLRPQRDGDRVTQDLRGSEFLELSSGVQYPALMGVIDGHMEALRVVQPRVYDALMDKIRALR